MISRRTFIRGLTAAAVAYPLSGAFGSWPSERSLNAYNVHTDEALEITYFSEGSYDTDALEKINYLLRCHYTNEVHPVNTGVLDLLCGIQDRLDGNRQIEVISAYRSPEYNDVLRTKSERVARNSLHLQGLAIDFAVSGVSREALARIAKSFFAGGVGKYREFVRIDIGPVRYW